MKYSGNQNNRIFLRNKSIKSTVDNRFAEHACIVEALNRINCEINTKMIDTTIVPLMVLRNSIWRNKNHYNALDQRD